MRLSDAQESNFLIYWNWMYFDCYQPNHFPVRLFLADCLQTRLLLRSSLQPPPLTTVDICAVTSMSASARRGQQWNEFGTKKNKSNALAFWCVMGVGIRTDAAREPRLKTQIVQSFAGETVSGQSGCKGKAAMKAGGWQSNNTPSLLLPCNDHCVHVGWHTSGMTSCIHAIAQPGGG